MKNEKKPKMPKTRLSKLQKWILEKCYTGGYVHKGGQPIKAMYKIDILRYFKATYLIGNRELPIIDNFKAFMTPQAYNKACSTISRSLRNLRDKGLVRLIGPKKIEAPNYDEEVVGKSEWLIQDALERAQFVPKRENAPVSAHLITETKLLKDKPEQRKTLF